MNAPARITAAQEHPLGPAFDLLGQRGRELGIAKTLLRNFITALEQPDDIRTEMVAFAKAQAAVALGEGGPLS